MTGTCQSVKGSCNLFIPQLNNFHTFLQFSLRIIQYEDIGYQENSGSIARC